MHCTVEKKTEHEMQCNYIVIWKQKKWKNEKFIWKIIKCITMKYNLQHDVGKQLIWKVKILYTLTIVREQKKINVFVFC